MGRNNLRNIPKITSQPLPNIQSSIQSVPPPPGMPPALPPPSGGSYIDPISSILFSLSTNPYLIGVFMILLNLGGRFLPLELTKNQEAFLQSPIVRPLILFTVIFIATRNLAVAFWLTLAIFSILWFLANEKSDWCIVPGWNESNNDDKEKAYQENIKKLNKSL
jgi:hypothetical protein